MSITRGKNHPVFQADRLIGRTKLLLDNHAEVGEGSRRSRLKASLQDLRQQGEVRPEPIEEHLDRPLRAARKTILGPFRLPALPLRPRGARALPHASILPYSALFASPSMRTRNEAD